MSYKEVEIVLDHAPHHWAPSTRLVAIALAERINPSTRQAWPSLADLSKRTGIAERQVRRHLRVLEDAGWIENHGQRPGAGGQPVSNLWTWRRYVQVGRSPMTGGGRSPMTPLRLVAGRSPMTPEPQDITTRENHKQVGHR